MEEKKDEKKIQISDEVSNTISSVEENVTSLAVLQRVGVESVKILRFARHHRR